MPHFAASKPRAILSLCTGDQYLHFSATPCGVFFIFMVWFSGVCVFFLVLCGLFFSVLVLCFFFPPYFVGFQLFGLILAQESQNQVDNPIKQLSKNSGVYLPT